MLSFPLAREIIGPVLVGAAVVFLYATVLLKLASDWWADESYSHGLLIPFVIGAIVFLNFQNLRSTPTKPRHGVGIFLVVSALLLLLSGTMGAELFLQRISLPFLFAGIIVYFLGFQILKKLTVPFILLLLAIPIPQIIYNKIAFPLQIMASKAANWGIHLAGIASNRNGNVIEFIPRGETQIVALEVVEACSGIRSLMTLATLAVILVYFTSKPGRRNTYSFYEISRNPDVWRGVILVILAAPVALVTNSARLMATGILTYKNGQSFATGWWHDISGWLVFISALILLAAANSALQKIFQKDREAATIRENSLTEKVGSVFAGNNGFVLIFTLILTGAVLINWLENRVEVTVERRPLANFPMILGDAFQQGHAVRFAAPIESVLRATDYTMRDYQDATGRRLNLYVGYYSSQRTGAVYHNPQNCLPGSGWEMSDGVPVEVVTPHHKRFSANSYVVTKGSYRGIIVYWFQGRGRFEASEYWDKAYTIFDSISRGRSDGAMVRIMTSIDEDESQARKAVLDFSGIVADRLDLYVPQ